MKYAWIAEQGKTYSLTEMCDVLDVSVSGYRAWKRGGKPDRKRLSDSQMLALIRALHAELKRAYAFFYNLAYDRVFPVNGSVKPGTS